MARPRTSFLSAMAHANHLIENEAMEIEAAAKQAAHIFKEDKDALLRQIYKNKNDELKKTVKRRQPKTEGKILYDEKNKAYYIYEGPVEFWLNGKSKELTVKIPTQETEFSKAKEKVNRELFEKGFNAFIKEAHFENYLKVNNI